MLHDKRLRNELPRQLIMHCKSDEAHKVCKLMDTSGNFFCCQCISEAINGNMPYFVKISLFKNLKHLLLNEVDEVTMDICYNFLDKTEFLQRMLDLLISIGKLENSEEDADLIELVEISVSILVRIINECIKASAPEIRCWLTDEVIREVNIVLQMNASITLKYVVYFLRLLIDENPIFINSLQQSFSIVERLAKIVFDASSIHLEEVSSVIIILTKILSSNLENEQIITIIKQYSVAFAKFFKICPPTSPLCIDLMAFFTICSENDILLHHIASCRSTLTFIGESLQGILVYKHNKLEIQTSAILLIDRICSTQSQEAIQLLMDEVSLIEWLIETVRISKPIVQEWALRCLRNNFICTSTFIEKHGVYATDLIIDLLEKNIGEIEKSSNNCEKSIISELLNVTDKLISVKEYSLDLRHLEQFMRIISSCLYMTNIESFDNSSLKNLYFFLRHNFESIFLNYSYEEYENNNWFIFEILLETTKVSNAILNGSNHSSQKLLNNTEMEVQWITIFIALTKLVVKSKFFQNEAICDNIVSLIASVTKIVQNRKQSFSSEQFMYCQCLLLLFIRKTTEWQWKEKDVSELNLFFSGVAAVINMAEDRNNTVHELNEEVISLRLALFKIPFFKLGFTQNLKNSAERENQRFDKNLHDIILFIIIPLLAIGLDCNKGLIVDREDLSASIIDISKNFNLFKRVQCWKSNISKEVFWTASAILFQASISEQNFKNLIEVRESILHNNIKEMKLPPRIIMMLCCNLNSWTMKERYQVLLCLSNVRHEITSEEWEYWHSDAAFTCFSNFLVLLFDAANQNDILNENKEITYLVLHLAQLDFQLRENKKLEKESIILELVYSNEYLIKALAVMLDEILENDRNLKECLISEYSELIVTIMSILSQLCTLEKFKLLHMTMPALIRIVKKTLSWNIYSDFFRNPNCIESKIGKCGIKTLTISLNLATVVFDNLTEFDETDTLVLVSVAKKVSSTIYKISEQKINDYLRDSINIFIVFVLELIKHCRRSKLLRAMHLIQTSSSILHVLGQSITEEIVNESSYETKIVAIICLNYLLLPLSKNEELLFESVKIEKEIKALVCSPSQFLNDNNKSNLGLGSESCFQIDLAFWSKLIMSKVEYLKGAAASLLLTSIFCAEIEFDSNQYFELLMLCVNGAVQSFDDVIIDIFFCLADALLLNPKTDSVQKSGIFHNMYSFSIMIKHCLFNFDSSIGNIFNGLSRTTRLLFLALAIEAKPMWFLPQYCFSTEVIKELCNQLSSCDIGSLNHRCLTIIFKQLEQLQTIKYIDKDTDVSKVPIKNVVREALAINRNNSNKKNDSAQGVDCQLKSHQSFKTNRSYGCINEILQTCTNIIVPQMLVI